MTRPTLTATEILARCRTAGIRLGLAPDGSIDLDAPPEAEALVEALVEALRPVRADVLGHLRREAALRDWQAAIEAVRERYDRLHARLVDRTPALEDVDLTEAIGEAIRAGELDAARERITTWRSAWMAALEAAEAPPAPPAPLADPADLAWLRRFVDAGAADRLPRGLRLAPWLVVADPGRFARHLLAEIEGRRQRAAAGLARQDLERFRAAVEAIEAEAAGAASTPAAPALEGGAR